MQYDLENSDLLGVGAGLRYGCECLEFGLTYTHVTAAANDGVSDSRLMLNVILRTIGGAETQVLGNDQLN